MECYVEVVFLFLVFIKSWRKDLWVDGNCGIYSFFYDDSGVVLCSGVYWGGLEV